MRLPVLLPAVALAAALTAPAGTAAAEAPASSSTLSARVAALQADVDAAGRALEQGARSYEQASTRLAVVTQQQFAVAAELDRQTGVSARTRTGVDALVRAAYKGQGLPPAVSAFLSGDPRALSDLARVRASVDRVDTTGRAALEQLTVSRARTQRLLAQKESLRRRALAEQREVDARQEQVAAQATALAARLQATSAALERALAAEAEAARRLAARRAAEASARAAARAAAAAAVAEQAVAPGYAPGPVAPSSSGGCAPASDHGYANGFLPDAVLCPLPGRPDHRLRTDAAQAFSALDAARVASGLPPLCVTDSYRSYAAQVDVFARKPHLAAVPGRSQHGWGLALDLCGGVERFDGEAHAWMRANGPRFGWVHPAWAQQGGSKPEAWHWEFQG